MHKIFIKRFIFVILAVLVGETRNYFFLEFFCENFSLFFKFPRFDYNFLTIRDILRILNNFSESFPSPDKFLNEEFNQWEKIFKTLKIDTQKIYKFLEIFLKLVQTSRKMDSLGIDFLIF